MKFVIVAFLGFFTACTQAVDNSVLIATASSFRPALQEISPTLNNKCNTKIQISSGSTGALITQIRQGAPFDLLISADMGLSQILINSSPNTYRENAPFARSPMAYWQPNASRKELTIAIANPKTAPFGRAAMQVISDKNPNLAIAANAAQAFVFVHTGAADAGYVPLPLLIAAEIPNKEFELIEGDAYSPILLHNVRLRSSPVLDCLAEQFNSLQTLKLLTGFGYLPP
jgi:molybdate transport system substrate-binding protein